MAVTRDAPLHPSTRSIRKALGRNLCLQHMFVDWLLNGSLLGGALSEVHIPSADPHDEGRKGGFCSHRSLQIATVGIITTFCHRSFIGSCPCPALGHNAND